MNTQDPRQIIRQQIRQLRNSLSVATQKRSAQSLVTMLKKHEKIAKAKTIAIYLTADGELNTAPFIDWCWQQGKVVYLPVIHPFSKGHLLFLRYDAHTEMTNNKYGISEPKLDIRNLISPNEIDIIFTPLVAFDDTGARLGMGGGFYDRTLASWYQNYQQDKASKPYPIGLAHQCQQVATIPCQSWDIPLPEIITPKQYFLF